MGLSYDKRNNQYDNWNIFYHVQMAVVASGSDGHAWSDSGDRAGVNNNRSDSDEGMEKVNRTALWSFGLIHSAMSPFVWNQLLHVCSMIDFVIIINVIDY